MYHLWKYSNKKFSKSFIPKLCISCKFLTPVFYECKKNERIDLVTGNVTLEKAKYTRSNVKKCGINAKWHVEKLKN